MQLKGEGAQDAVTHQEGTRESKDTKRW